MFLLSFKHDVILFTSCVFLDFNLEFPICISEINKQLNCSGFMFFKLFFCCADFLSFISPVRNQHCMLTSFLLCVNCLTLHNLIVMSNSCSLKYACSCFIIFSLWIYLNNWNYAYFQILFFSPFTDIWSFKHCY